MQNAWTTVGSSRHGKTPFWGCGSCGFARNFADRGTCWKCGARGPDRAVAAEKLRMARQREPAARGRTGRAGGPASTWTPGPQSPASKPAPWRKDATKEGPPADQELAKAKQEIAELRRQLQQGEAETKASAGAEHTASEKLDDAEALAEAKVKRLESQKQWLLQQQRDSPEQGFVVAALGSVEQEISAARAALHACWAPERRLRRHELRCSDAETKRQKRADAAAAAETALQAAKSAFDDARKALAEAERECAERQRELAAAKVAGGMDVDVGGVASGIGPQTEAGAPPDGWPALFARVAQSPEGIRALPEAAASVENARNGAASLVSTTALVPPFPQAPAAAPADPERGALQLGRGRGAVPPGAEAACADLVREGRCASARGRGHVPAGAEGACIDLVLAGRREAARERPDSTRSPLRRGRA